MTPTTLSTINFHDANVILSNLLKTKARTVKPIHWQGRDISNKPEMATRELPHVHVSVRTGDVTDASDLAHWQRDIQPNLPWADDHFLERVGGVPLNPGKTWEYWPFNKSAGTFLNEQGQFNHSYMERFWPGRANTNRSHVVNVGIRGYFGDLDDLVRLIAKDPLTRQAYLPIFFPEDTGIADGGRKPCTLGYHFMIRDDQLHIYYPMRSCDFVRHFRDDCYLAIRLGLWIIDQLRDRERSTFRRLTLGNYSMFISSLHVFANDLRE